MPLKPRRILIEHYTMKTLDNISNNIYVSSCGIIDETYLLFSLCVGVMHVWNMVLIFRYLNYNCKSFNYIWLVYK